MYVKYSASSGSLSPTRTRLSPPGLHPVGSFSANVGHSTLTLRERLPERLNDLQHKWMSSLWDKKKIIV